MTPRCLQPPSGAAATRALAARASVPELDTARLCLRAPRIEDVPAWSAIFDLEGDYLGTRLTAEDAYGTFCLYAAGWLLHGHGLWSVTRKTDGLLVGFVLVGLEWDDDEPELGWMLDQDARGHGYATEAATAARDWALDLLGPGAVVSYIHAPNAASAAVAARLGATRDRADESRIGDGTQVWRHGAQPGGDL